MGKNTRKKIAALSLAGGLLLGVGACSQTVKTPNEPAAEKPAPKAQESKPETPKINESDYSREPSKADGAQIAGGEMLPTGLEYSAEGKLSAVTMSFKGADKLWWRADYQADPTEEGRGMPLTVEGAKDHLVVQINGLRMPLENEDFLNKAPAPTKEIPGVTGAKLDAIFEGGTQLVIGTTDKLPYRVTTTDSALRVEFLNP